MLKTLKDLFDRLVAPTPVESPAHGAHTLQLATAVLLVEVMRADAELGAAERGAVIFALRDKFGLADDEMSRLLELADQTARTAGDYFAFTSKINDGFDMQQKLTMIEHMWRVAYADGTLSGHENHVMRKVGDLLHIPHGAYIHAKMRARPATSEG